MFFFHSFHGIGMAVSRSHHILAKIGGGWSGEKKIVQQLIVPPLKFHSFSFFCTEWCSHHCCHLLVQTTPNFDCSARNFQFSGLSWSLTLVSLTMKGAKVTDVADSSSDSKGQNDNDDEKSSPATMKQLFMLADSSDMLLFYVGTVGALVNGTGDPLMMVFFSESLKNLSGDPDDLLKDMTQVAYIMITLGCILLVFAALQYYCFSMLTKRLTHKLRMAWFKAVVRQDIGWFDTNNAGEMPGRISSALIAYETAMGGKFSEGIQFFSTLITGLVIGFYYNAYVALVIFGCVPFGERFFQSLTNFISYKITDYKSVVNLIHSNI